MKGPLLRSLYNYQQRFYSEIGASFFGIDVIKNFLLKSDINKLLPLIRNGVIDTEDITNVYNARPLKYSFSELLRKARKGLKNPRLLIMMAGLLSRVKKIGKLVWRMPKTYNDGELLRWQNKIKKFFN